MPLWLRLLISLANLHFFLFWVYTMMRTVINYYNKQLSCGLSITLQNLSQWPSVYLPVCLPSSLKEMVSEFCSVYESTAVISLNPPIHLLCCQGTDGWHTHSNSSANRPHRYVMFPGLYSVMGFPIHENFYHKFKIVLIYIFSRGAKWTP